MGGRSTHLYSSHNVRGLPTSDVHNPPSIVHRPTSTVQCPQLTALHRPPSDVHRPPSIVHRPVSTVNHPPPSTVPTYIHRPPSSVHHPPPPTRPPPHGAAWPPPSGNVLCSDNRASCVRHRHASQPTIPNIIPANNGEPSTTTVGSGGSRCSGGGRGRWWRADGRRRRRAGGWQRGYGVVEPLTEACPRTNRPRAAIGDTIWAGAVFGGAAGRRRGRGRRPPSLTSTPPCSDALISRSSAADRRP